jgi:UDP-N-acetylmuramyl pentapeptide phosphotransferase/UDP-N-acetylglucosamine-1-phosphate transferase
MIDGVNCLAAGIAIVIGTFYGSWYTLVGYNAFALLSFSLVGALLGFIYYNKTPAKIFMGDTGSLLVGLVIAMLSVKFIEFNKLYAGPYHVTAVPAVTIAILIVPLFDLARVFYIRMKAGKSPMHADRNHLHHRLLDLGFSDMQVTGILCLVTLFFIALSISICRIRAEIVLATVLLCAIALSAWVESASAKRNRSS